MCSSALVGALFSLTNLLTNLGARDVSGPLVLILSKLNLPLTMALSRALFRTPYTRWHMGGCALLLGGVALSVQPALAAASAEALGVLLLVLSNLPLAVSFLFLEHNLKRHHQRLSIPWLWLWICVFELPIGFLFSPGNALVQGLPMGQIFPNFVDGFRCLFAGSDGGQSTGCGRALAFYLASIPPGLAMNMSFGHLNKLTSASLVFTLRTVSLVLASLFFAFPFVMGDEVTPLSAPLVGGVLLVTVGLIVYVSRGEPEPAVETSPNVDQAPAQEKALASPSPSVSAYLRLHEEQSAWVDGPPNGREQRIDGQSYQAVDSVSADDRDGNGMEMVRGDAR